MDSYDPGAGKASEIVSRKFTQIAALEDKTTAIRYINELSAKYPANAKIASVPSQLARSTHANAGLAGKLLRGQLILEVPEQTLQIPQSVLDAASRQGILIRDTAGKVYNP